MPFFDTNILIYAFDSQAGERQALAEAALTGARATRELFVSAQVLNEFFYQVTKPKPSAMMHSQEAFEVVRDLALTSEVIPLDASMTLDAARLRMDHSLSFWDALIIVAASRSQTDVLLSEDMQHGRQINGVSIQNPFV